MYKFIVFEGPDGCGKSTILDLVYSYMKEKSIPVEKTREPGGTSLGESIRDLVLKSSAEVSPMTEALLMASSTDQLVDELIKPGLEKSHMISDRFVQSSLVYQGLARGLGLEKIKELNDFAIRGQVPDLSLYFDLDYETISKRKKDRGSTDNIEKEGEDFHRLIHEGYEMVYNKYKDEYNMVRIDGSGTVDEVFDQVIGVLREREII